MAKTENSWLWNIEGTNVDCVFQFTKSHYYMCRNRNSHSTYIWNSSKSLKGWKFGKKIWISLLNEKWVFLQNWLCPRKFSIWVNFDGRIVLSGHPSLIGWRPLTRSRFRFWWQFNGDFFDWLVSLLFFAQFDSRFYFCIFWIFRSCFIICANEDRLGSTRTAQTLGQTRLAEIYFKNGTYWIYSELPKHLDSFR